MNKLATIGQLAAEYQVSKASISIKIKEGRIKATKKKYDGGGACGYQYFINRSDYEEYRANRYNRKLSTYNGKLIFDKSKGLHSVPEAAKIVGCNKQQIYYHVREGLIPATRVRSSWIIHIDDIKAYQAKIKKFSKVKYLKIEMLDD